VTLWEPSLPRRSPGNRKGLAMIPHLPRPARMPTAAFAPTLRGQRKPAKPVAAGPARRPKPPTRAFDAAHLIAPPAVAANATSSSD
jgi:hypothetical protein